MSLQTSCSAKCVVRHAYEKMCPFRNIQCPFVACPEKVAFNSVVDHLWTVHNLLQFPTEEYSSKFSINEQTFSKNFAANPFLILYEDRQFILEICRKHDSGLWHFWIYYVGSPRDSNFFAFELRICNKNGTEDVSYKGPAISIDVPFNDVFSRCHGLVVPDNVLRRLCDFGKMCVSYHLLLKQVDFVDYETYYQSFPQDNGDAVAITRPAMSVGLANGNSVAGKGDYHESPEATRRKDTFANAPKVAVGVPNKYGKVIYADSHKLFVGNLFDDECKEELIQVFSPFGEIADVLFFRNSQHMKKFPFYAFVIFKQEESVELVCKNKPFTFPNGQPIIVQPKI